MTAVSMALDSRARDEASEDVLTAQALVELPGGMGTVSEAVLALRYGKPLILFGPSESFGAFPTELERTESLERVREFLLAAVR